MKKTTILLALMTTLISNCAFAEANNCNASSAKKCSTVADSSGKDMPQSPAPKQEFAWGIGLCGLAVIGTVVGFTASMASSN